MAQRDSVASVWVSSFGIRVVGTVVEDLASSLDGGETSESGHSMFRLLVCHSEALVAVAVVVVGAAAAAVAVVVVVVVAAAAVVVVVVVV